ncbi:haloacid dehalogenase [Rhodobacter sp. TJ_12]|uniref:HAD family hydrolase n=1 Tax=Rhodobacter sp. TJ_12 TaxID=2029399 RepID=UPI001CC05E21|nr:HAD family phosphatase [Rhodobacter sp. TJ_12]MBZ4023685.1 haloacid dehalogenase [Rhodobacter sp. TJ_12]
MTKAVVFDIGKVLIEWNPEPFYEARLGPHRAAAFFAESGIHAQNEQIDLGAPFRETVEALAKARPDWAEAIMLWHDEWLTMASPGIPHSARLLAALKAKGVPVFALSNFGRETFEIACAAYPYLRSFDRLFVSAHHGLIKPDPRFYELLERDTGLSGADLLFADDRPENIDAAAARGWKTHLFEHPQGWADRLVAEGLLTQEDAQ